MQNGIIVTWKEGWRFPIKLNIHLPQDPAIPLLVIYSREIKTHVLVLSLWHTIIWGSQKLEKTQVPTSRGKGTQTAVYSHNGKLLSKRTDQTSEKQQCGWVWHRALKSLGIFLGIGASFVVMRQLWMSSWMGAGHQKDQASVRRQSFSPTTVLWERDWRLLIKDDYMMKLP